MAAISHVFTIARVAEILGEDEAWLSEIAIDMDPEDGHLWVVGVGEDHCPAVIQYGVECLRDIIAELRAAGRAHEPTAKP